jgi:uncharacterized protein involved in exopolysaccharide biosynthesis
MRNLAQEARKKQLKTARWILIVVGILQLLMGSFFVFNARSLVKAQFEKEIQGLRAQGMVVDEEKLQELEDSATKATQLLNLGGVLGGICFIFLGLLRVPLPGRVHYYWTAALHRVVRNLCVHLIHGRW